MNTEKIENLNVVLQQSELTDKRATKAAAGADWVLMLVNATAHVVTHIKSEADRDWFKLLNPVGRTCNGTNPAEVTQCANEKKFLPILVTPCDSGPFLLDLGVQIEDKIYALTAAPFNIRPNCNFNGGWIGVY